MRPSILTSLAAAVVLIPGLATAALAQSSQSRVVAQSPQQAAAETQAALRALVVAEERYFAAHVTYTTDLVALAPQPKPAGVYLIVTHAGGRAWRASAQHASLPGKSCVIYVGQASDFPMPRTKAKGRRPTKAQQGEPVCDPV